MGGLNWYVYCSNNPVNRIDLLGLLNLDLEFIDMHDDNWKDEDIGNSTEKKIDDIGCYLSGFTAATNAVTGQDLTPSDINGKNNNFGTDSGGMNPTQAATNQGMVKDYWTREVQGGDLTNKINELNDSDTEYGVLAQVDSSHGNHWVGVNGGTVDIGGTSYIQATGTSTFDYKENSIPNNWIIDEDSETILIPTTEVIQINTFTKEGE